MIWQLCLVQHYNMNFEYSQPHCSSFSTDHSTVIASEGRQQISPPAEPRQTQVPQWNPIPVKHHVPDNRYSCVCLVLYKSKLEQLVLCIFCDCCCLKQINC